MWFPQRFIRAARTQRRWKVSNTLWMHTHYYYLAACRRQLVVIVIQIWRCFIGVRITLSRNGSLRERGQAGHNDPGDDRWLARRTATLPPSFHCFPKVSPRLFHPISLYQTSWNLFSLLKDVFSSASTSLPSNHTRNILTFLKSNIDKNMQFTIHWKYVN